MSFQINPVKDIPEEDAKLLGHDKIVANLKTFLEQKNMITPLSIAIHGDWGSGKTSIMKTLAKKLEHDKFEVIFFEAWKYEYANPSLGLISELAETYGNREIIQTILRAAIYILSNKYLSLDPEAVIKIIKDSKQATETLSKQLHKVIKQKIKKKMLVIIIDDLDRCDVENTLQLLAIMKLFLDVENCICIAAVDFNRLKQAWRTKYEITDTSNNGSEYLDKIFQIRIGIPRPPPVEIQDYLKTLVNNVPDDIAELFSKVLPKNPRAIKRILNLIAYRQNLLQSHHKEFSAIFWTLLEEIVSNQSIIYISDRLKANGSSIGHLLLNVGSSTNTIKDTFNNIIGKDIFTNHAEKLTTFFLLGNRIFRSIRIELTSINSDFELLYSATNEALK